MATTKNVSVGCCALSLPTETGVAMDSHGRRKTKCISPWPSPQSHTSVTTAFGLFGTDPIHASKVAHSRGKAGFMRNLGGVLFVLENA